jgi:CIC family chloride channel protein
MTAMMAATLQAPLSALMAVMELTANPNIILPAMLIIVVATMTMSQVFRKKSVFTSRLNALGLDYPPTPMTQHLLRTGVESVMSRNYLILDPQMDAIEVRQAIQTNTVTGNPIPEWIVVESEPSGDTSILSSENVLSVSYSNVLSSLKLVEIRQLQKNIPHINVRSTLAEALSTLDQSGTATLCVRGLTNAVAGPIVGVLSRRHIAKHAGLSQGSFSQ